MNSYVKDLSTQCKVEGEFMAETVSMIRTSKYDEDAIKGAVYRSLDLLNYRPTKPISSVSIKVNLCYYWDSSTGETTDRRVVSSAIDYIRERWNEKASISIIESDATAVRMKYAFRMLGYEELAAEKGVLLLNLSQEPSERITVSSGDHTFTFSIPQTILNSDIFLSIPKPKYHITGISCALKNQFGCNPIRKKILYHPKLNEVIIALNKAMKPDIALVDGIIVRGSHPKKLGLVLAGTNPLCIDFIVAQIMGLDPYKIGHIKLAIEEKIGEVENIVTTGEKIDDLRREFPKIPQASALSKFTGSLKRIAYGFYLKLVDNVPLY